MSFKLTIKNSQGIFKVHLNRDVSNKEIMEICQVATNVLPDEVRAAAPVYGPHPPPSSSLGSLAQSETIIGLRGQTQLGERPVSTINLGGYKEPQDGVRIKMLHMVSPIVPAVKAFRAVTDVSMMGCKEIIYGNYPCPILSLEDAQKIIEDFHKLEIYAKIVPAFDNKAA